MYQPPVILISTHLPCPTPLASLFSLLLTLLPKYKHVHVLRCFGPILSRFWHVSASPWFSLLLWSFQADTSGQRRRLDSGPDNHTSLSPQQLDELLRLNDSLHASVQHLDDRTSAYPANVFGSLANIPRNPIPESVPTEHSESEDENNLAANSLI